MLSAFGIPSTTAANGPPLSADKRLLTDNELRPTFRIVKSPVTVAGASATRNVASRGKLSSLSVPKKLMGDRSATSRFGRSCMTNELRSGA